jgi:hypothetical protein
VDFGIALPTPADAWKVVKRAEELGVSDAWFYDMQMLSGDCFIAMGADQARLRLSGCGRPQPRPTNGILVAITVMNCTLASSGRLAM